MMQLQWLPMRLMLPLLLILVSSSMVGGFWWFENQRAMTEIEHLTLADQSQDLHRLSTQLQAALQRGDEDGVRALISDFGSEPNLRYALTVDADGRVLASTRLGWIGLAVDRIAEPGLAGELARAAGDLLGHVRLSEDRMSVWGNFALGYPAGKHAIRANRVGMLIANLDISGSKKAAQHHIDGWARLFAVLVLFISVLFWMLSRFAITHRMNRLIAAANRARKGDFSARARLSGRDELAQIGAAFDAMIEHLGAETVRLQQLSRAVENMNESVLITDADGCILYVNSAFSHITGYAADEVIGRNPRLLKSGKHPKEFYEAFWNCISRGRTWKGRMTDRKKDGTLYLARVSVAPLLNAEGRVTHYVGVQEDISEQQKVELQLLQAQKMESLGTLVGGIAHDFNNMLAGMVGNLYMARKLARDMPEIIRHLARVEQLSFRAADMIKQLLAFARKDMIQFKSINLTPFIKEAFKLARVAIPENIHCIADLSQEALHIECDATQVQQMLMNLLTNARDAVRDIDDPEIRVSLQRYAPDKAFLAAHPEAVAGAYAVLSVEDNGCGIPEHHLGRIFEPFFTTKGVGQGSGLGLSMLFGTMKSHKGVIAVQSQPGMGSAFRLYFPLSEDAQHSMLPEDSATFRGDGEQLLLADDEPVVRETISEMLRIDGFAVDVASDGLDAVEKFAKQPEAYAAVILDVVMPHMGGMEAARRMREIRPDIPVVFATGYDRNHVLRSSEEMQNIASLSKPLHSATLRQALGSLLEKKNLLD